MNRREKKLFEAITRRDALRAALALAAAGATSSFGMGAIARAAAEAGSSRRFLFLYFPGGWDQLLFLDPRDPTANGNRYADENRQATLTEPGYGALEGNGFSSRIVRAGALTFGPATEVPNQATPLLSKHADRISILRGMNMGTLGHEVGFLYFLTGRFPIGTTARGSSVATECAAFARSDLPIPVLSLRMLAYNDGYPSAYTALRVESLDDLLVVLARGSSYVEKDPVEEALAEYAKRPAPCAVDVYDRTGLLGRMRDADDHSRATLASKLADRFRFATGDDEASTAIRKRYGFSKGDAESPGARAAFAATAIKQGVAQCVSATIGSGTDTHTTGNLAHARLLHPPIAALSALIDDLATTDAPEQLQREGGRTWLDHTTILAFSEFARTPMFNTSGGRDHHLASSCLLAGAGIAGGRVVGATGEVGMSACRYDVRAGRVVPAGGETLGPEHVRATLLASAGLPTDAAGIHAPPIAELLAKGRG